MYKTSNENGATTPCAQIAVNKSLLKEYRSNNERVVYLKNGDNFQIQLFNNTTTRVGVRIYINGELIDGVLVIRPGERCWLERFIEENQKFVFKTYEVDELDEEVSKAIANNGEVKIEFYKEMVNNFKTYSPKTNNIWTYYSKSSINEPFTTTITNPILNEPYYFGSTSTSYNDAVDCSYKATFCGDDISTDTNELLSSSANEESNVNLLCETGRVEKGSYSSQKLDSVYLELERTPSWTEVIRILPLSRKQVSVNDMQKTYCTECGRKISPKFKFCPFCGNKCE